MLPLLNGFARLLGGDYWGGDRGFAPFPILKFSQLTAGEPATIGPICCRLMVARLWWWDPAGSFHQPGPIRRPRGIAKKTIGGYLVDSAEGTIVASPRLGRLPAVSLELVIGITTVFPARKAVAVPHEFGPTIQPAQPIKLQCHVGKVRRNRGQLGRPAADFT
jgi:hypothetical protein